MPKAEFDHLRKCVNRVSSQAKWVSDIEKDDRELFPTICCSYRLGIQCINQITDRCDSSPINPRQYWIRMLDSMLKNIEQIACSRYDEAFCTNKQYFKKLNNLRYQGNKSEFLVMPVMRIADRFTQDEV